MQTEEQRRAQFQHMQQLGVVQWEDPETNPDFDPNDTPDYYARQPIGVVGWIVLVAFAAIILASLFGYIG